MSWKEHIDMLVCPITHRPLREASTDELERVRAALRAHPREDIDPDKVDGALVRDDGVIAYPVVDSIPCLLAECAVELAS